MTEDEETSLVYRLKGRLRKSSPIRQAVEQRLAGGEIQSSDIEQALNSLHGKPRRRWREKALATWLIGRSPLSGEQSDRALVRLASILQERPGHSTGCLVAAGCFLNWLVLIYIFFTSLSDTPVNRVRAFAASALGRIGRPAALVPLCEAATELDGKMASSDTAVRRSAVLALSRLLPTLQGTGYGEVPQKTMRSIFRLVTHAPYEILMSALSVIELAGTGNDVRALKRIEKRMATHGARVAYDKAMCTLEERARREKEQAMLLRPATSPGSPEQILLRPASGGGDVNESLLLRPSYEEETYTPVTPSDSEQVIHVEHKSD